MTILQLSKKLTLLMPLLLLSMVEAKSDNSLSNKELHAVMGIITNYILISDTTVLKTTLKKTGQTISYYPGDDGTYQKGVTPSYTRSNDVVKDHITGLQWQDDVEAKTVMKTWSEAQNYCSDLGLDGGGWRLPTIQELQSIIVNGVYDPSIDTTAYVNYVTSAPYLSSTTQAHSTSGIWIVYFIDGSTSSAPYHLLFHVRCVR